MPGAALGQNSSRYAPFGRATHFLTLSPFAARRNQNASRRMLTHTPRATNLTAERDETCKNPAILRGGRWNSSRSLPSGCRIDGPEPKRSILIDARGRGGTMHRGFLRI